MDALILAEHITKRFGDHLAVDGVSFSVNPGEIYGLVGSDGAGKTTTIRLLCGALQLTGGQVTIAGRDITRQTELARENIGYLAQRFSLYEELTVFENIRFFAEVRGLSAQQWQPRCLEILAFVGLESYRGRRAGHLSGGMKQKLGLAAALVHQPRVLLLDEPTTGVDPVTRQDFWQLIIRLAAEEGIAVLVSTPYMDEAARCGRVGFMQDGKLLLEGPPRELPATLEGRILEIRGRPLARLRSLVETDPDVEDAQMFGDRLHLRVRPAMRETVAERLSQVILHQGYQLERIRPVPAQLEDVFIYLLEHHQ